MTANVFEKDRQACLAAGMNGFIPKPLELEEFLDAVSVWLPLLEESQPQVVQLPAPVVEAPGACSPLDMEAYVKRMGGNREMAEMILKGFIEQLPAQLGGIAAAIQRG